jgi:hypothetical protein
MTMLKIMAYSLAAMLFCSPALAENSAYQIELMVFSQAMPTTEVFEQTTSEISWPSGLTELSAYNKPDATTLDNSYAAIAKDSAYRPIMHVAWVQPKAAGELSAPVHIQDPDGKLNGYLQIQQGQGLQLAVDLELTASSGDGSVIYRLNEKRAIKLNDVYYLDHPKFGVVVKVSPL